MSIGWPYYLAPLDENIDLERVKNDSFKGKGVPRNLQSNDERIRLLPVDMKKEEFDILLRQQIQLNTLEVDIVDNFGERINDIKFTWSLVQYENDQIKINFQF